MPFAKPHREFERLNLDEGWERAPGYPTGAAVYQRILAADINDQAGTGSRTRLLRFEPGAFSTEPFMHRHWEEVYLMEGDLLVGNDEHGHGGEAFVAPTYACRPPGVWHGPFKSERGCLLIEFHYYDESHPYSEPVE
jgi:hypothetical protein